MANSAPSPDNSERAQVCHSDKPQKDGASRTGHTPDWLELSLEREKRYQLWDARPTRNKDVIQVQPFYKRGSQQDPTIQKPEPLHSDETDEQHSLFETVKNTPKDEHPGALVISQPLELEGAQASAPPPTEGETQQDLQPNKPRQEGYRWTRLSPDWLELSREREKRYQSWDTRPKRKKDVNQINLLCDEGFRQEPPTQKPAPPAEQLETSRKTQENDLEPLHSEGTEKPHSLFETVQNTDKDEQPDALCDNIIADSSESMNNNVPTVADSQHDIVVTSSDTPSSDEGGVHSHTNNGDPSSAEHSDAAASALMVRMDQNYTERGKRKKKRWPKPKRFLCKVFFQLRDQLKLNKGILTSADGQTSSPVFVVPHDQRGVRLVHAHDLPSAEGRKAYYDQKASHEGPHLITDELSSVVYQIKISKGQKEPIVKWVHRNQVKPYKASTDSTGDKDLTNPDLVGKKVVQAGTN